MLDAAVGEWMPAAVGEWMPAAAVPVDAAAGEVAGWMPAVAARDVEIGRASCRERVYCTV